MPADDASVPVGTVPSDAGMDDHSAPSAEDPLLERPLSLLVVLGLFVFAFGLSLAVTQPVRALVPVGEPGTISRLLLGVVCFQLIGMGGAILLYLYARQLDPRRYFRLGSLSQWTLFYGAAVGLTLMLLTVVATITFDLLALEPAESGVAAATDPTFYLVLFLVSTFVVVPFEELFFRGVLQRGLEEECSNAVAIGLASLLFMYIHTPWYPSVAADLLTFGLFYAMGIALGVSYALTKNLLVPILGHAIFNGTQILVRLVEVLG